MAKVRIINGKGDWGAEPPTGADDHDLQTFADDFIAQGGVLFEEDGSALVTQSGTPGMSVQVAKGVIYVPNSSWTENSAEPKFYIVVRDAITVAVPITSNPAGSTRIDLVCQQIDKITTPNDDADNVCPITVVAGTPGGGIPSTPNDYEVLAQVSVPSGATSITNANITDARRRVFAYPHLSNPGIKIVADAATITFDSENGKYNKFYTTVTANRQLAVANIPIGMPFTVFIEQGSGGSKIPLWWTTILWDFGIVPIFATSAGSIGAYTFIKLASGNYMGFIGADSAQIS